MAETYEVYPQVHRDAITSVDGASPSPSLAIDARGKQICRFDIALSGVAVTSLKVVPIFWSEEDQAWVVGEEKEFTAVGDYTLMVDSSGGVVKLGWLFLRVSEFTGTSFSLTAKHQLL